MSYVLFIKSECPYCVETEKLLHSKNLSFKKVVFNEKQQQILDEIKEAYEWKTVPMIFHRLGKNIKFVGGFDDLAEHLSDE